MTNANFTINGINYNFTTLDCFIEDSRVAELKAVNAADSAGMNTAIALTAAAIRESVAVGHLLNKKEVSDLLFKRIYQIEKTDSGKSNVYKKAKIVNYLLNSATQTIARMVETSYQPAEIEFVTIAIKAADGIQYQSEILEKITPNKRESNTESSNANTITTETDSAVCKMTLKKDVTPEEAARALMSQIVNLLSGMDDSHRLGG